MRRLLALAALLLPHPVINYSPPIFNPAVSIRSKYFSKRDTSERGEEDSTTTKTKTINESVGEGALRAAFSIANAVNDLGGEDNDAESNVERSVLRVERDMELLDDSIGTRNQLSTLELALLSMTVAVAGISPLVLPIRVVEVLAPSMAALSASIGVSAEYVGRVAVADGKEIAAVTLQAAAEAESLLSQSERSKAVLPLCVGIGAAAASFALLVPILIEELTISSLQQITEIYLLSPLVATLAAAVAGLSCAESRALAARAINLGNRRFAKKGEVGRTWLSATEQIDASSRRMNGKWVTFVTSTIPAPIIGTLIPGSLATKTIVTAAFAAAQSAFFLSQAEYYLARATDAVAFKARSAAVSDTYANQGARSGAILPFTSALGGLCAAATAAVVELLPVASNVVPIAQSLVRIGFFFWLVTRSVLGGPSLNTNPVLALLPQTVVIFPTLGALFAAAASVSKARCEVDALAASQAASALSLPLRENDKNGYRGQILEPFSGVKDLIRLTSKSAWRRVKKFRKKKK